MIRATSVLVAVSALSMLASAPALAQANLSGDWELTIDSPQGSRTVPVSLTQDGEKLTGAFKSPAGELPLAGTLSGADVKLAFTVNLQGTPLEITMTGKVDGETFAGKADFGGMAEGTFSGKRPAPAAATADTPSPVAAPAGSTAVAIAGTWEVTVKTGAGDYPLTAILTEDAGRIAGTCTTPIGEMPITGTLEGTALKLSMTAKTPQGDIPVSLTGDLDGDFVVNGKAEFGGMGQGEWTAKRKQ